MLKSRSGGLTPPPNNPALKGDRASGTTEKSPEERRTEQFNIGLSPVELAQIKGKADETSQTVTAFIRASALEQKITVPEIDRARFYDPQ